MLLEILWVGNLFLNSDFEFENELEAGHDSGSIPALVEAISI